MLFNSISFLYYFLPIVLIIYFIVPNSFKNFILLFFSFLFYFYGEPKYIFLMIIEILISYIGALFIEKYRSKDILVITVTIHILILCLFKYTNFMVSNINHLFHTNMQLFNIALPIGISFYTFQMISYEIDVFKRKVEVQKNFFQLATYISLFPQLIAGPIVRYQLVEEELKKRNHNFSNFAYGVRRFIIGLSKKILIANILGELCMIFLASSEKTVLFYWIYAISYMLEIYFDFSGYSDMAIGLGRMFGFHFLENFDYPYISTSITEFWRRWHISLGSWFRDYVYIPLGGNRKNFIRNVLIVWALTGIWHGASWNFIIWGLFFGVLLLIEKLILKKRCSHFPKWIQRIYTLFLVMISFIIFGAKNMKDAFSNIVGLFNFKIPFLNDFTIYYLKNYSVILIIAIIASTPMIKKIIQRCCQNKKLNLVISILEPIILIALLLINTAYLIDSSYSPFLYFRF